MRPAGILIRPARLYIYNKHVLCLRFNLLRTESEAQQQMNAEQSRRQDLNLRLSPYEGDALAKLSYTGIICFSATGRSRTCDAKLFRLPLYRLSYSGKLDFLLISGENCKEPNRGPEGNRTLHTRLAKPNRLLGSCEPINQILFSVQLLPIMCFRVAECI